MITNPLVKVPFYSQPSVAIAYSLLDQNNFSELHTFIPAFDFANQMSRTKIVDYKERKYVEVNLNELENQGNKHLVDTIRNSHLNTPNESFIAKIDKIYQKCIAILYKLFPSRLIDNKIVSSLYNRVTHYFNIIGILSTPTEVGPNRIALIFRSKELAREKERYDKKLGNYAALLFAQSKLSILSETDKEVLGKEKTEIDELKIKIDLATRKLRVEYFKYIMEITKYVLSNFSLILSFSPIKSLIDIAAVVQKLPGVMELIDFGLAFLGFGQMKEKTTIFNNWEERYRKWQDRNQHTTEIKHSNISNKINPNQLPIIKEQQIQNSQNWNSVKNHLYNVKLDEFEKWDEFLEKSLSLWDKTLVRREKKVIELGISDGARLKIEAFLLKFKEGLTEVEFHNWVSKQSPLSLLRLYVVQQENIEHSTKKIINQIIGSKLKLEKKFLHFKNIQHNFHYYYSATSLILSILIGISGGILLSAGLATGLIFSLAISSIVIHLSFWLANSLLSSRHKGHKSSLLNFRIACHQLRYDINNYWLKVKEKELEKIEPDFKKMVKRSIKLPEIHGIEHDALKKYLDLEKKNNKFFKSLEELKERRRVNEAKDFFIFAQLEEKGSLLNSKALHNDNEILSELLLLFQEIDFDLISPELKDLIKIELGMDIERLKRELGKVNNQKALNILRKDFLSFFTLDDTAYTEFIKYQTARVETGNLKNLS
jgi:hypothetical protein